MPIGYDVVNTFFNAGYFFGGHYIVDVDNQLMHLIKLTTARSKSTYGDVSWVPGTTVSISEPERGDTLARPGLLHVYHGDTIAEALALGLMMDPIHANIGRHARAYEVRGELVVRRAVLGGAHALDVGDELQVVSPTVEQRVRYGIYCTQAAIGDRIHKAFQEWLLEHPGAVPLKPQEMADMRKAWSRWAARWLSGEDRSEDAAAMAWAAALAALAAWAVADAAMAAYAAMAAHAARAATYAARAWAYAAYAAMAAWAWEDAAMAAAMAAEDAVDLGINLGKLALRAIEGEQ